MSDLVHTLAIKLLRDESGVTGIEYGLIASFIAVVCVSVWGVVGRDLDRTFDHVRDTLRSL